MIRNRSKKNILLFILALGLLLPFHSAHADGNPPPTATQTPLPTNTPAPTPTLQLVDTPVIPTEAPNQESYPASEIISAPLPPAQEQQPATAPQSGFNVGPRERLLIGGIILAVIVIGVGYALVIMRRNRGST